jgi:hypothetical protein
MDLFSKKDVDLALCGHIMTACVEASIVNKIPFIVTSAIPLTPGKREKKRTKQV